MCCETPWVSLDLDGILFLTVSIDKLDAYSLIFALIQSKNCCPKYGMPFIANICQNAKSKVWPQCISNKSFMSGLNQFCNDFVILEFITLIRNRFIFTKWQEHEMLVKRKQKGHCKTILGRGVLHHKRTYD